MLYDLTLHANRPSMDPSKPILGPHVDGVVGLVSHAFVGQLTRQMGQMTISYNPSMIAPTSQNVSFPTQTSDIHSIQSKNPKNAHKPIDKQNNRNKNYNVEQGTTYYQNANARGIKEKKLKFPCNI
jgi:hypothetical protein